MSQRRRVWLAFALLLAGAFTFRLFVAVRLANDAPDDGRVYSQLARNILEQHVYSHETEPPYVPSLIRLPGYPLLLATVYSIFGHRNDIAVRILQALIDTATCILICLVAFQWVPDVKGKHAAAIAALTLAAICPFTTIYTATILTEVPTNFFAVGLVLAATLALKAPERKRALLRWAAAGMLAGVAVLFRPDSGLFAAAVGLTIVISAMANSRRVAENKSEGVLEVSWSAIPQAAVFSVAFCLVLVPWTIRNRVVFHLFQPLAPAHGEMPGEFVPRGYLQWLRTWLDDGRYIEPVLWPMETAPIKIDQFPAAAFDSPQERDRVAALLERYNHPPADPEPEGSPEENSTEEDKASGAIEDQSAQTEVQQDVEMTPEIDAGFAQLARERIARAPVRYYLWLPAKRAAALWFDTHSQYYPFEGELLPLKDLDHENHQHLWLPLFALLTLIYSGLGIAGAWFLWRSGDVAVRRWVILAFLIIILRLGFFASLENPEPRYTVEIFPFLSILGGTAISYLVALIISRKPA